MELAQFYQPLSDQKVKCSLCPRDCIILPDETGYCGVRENRAGKLYSLVHSRPNALNVDPIEKKPLYHVNPGSKILSLGTVGCNLNCKFCQNWNISCSSFDSNQALDLSPTRIVQLALHYEAKAVAFTYNEPTIFAEYVMDTSIKSSAEGLLNVMVTNGYISDVAIQQVYSQIDAANVDLKSFDENFYKQHTKSTLKPVLNTLVKLKELGIWLEITNLIIPGLNDDIDLILKMCEWIKSNLGDNTPIHFTAFHPDHLMTNIPPTTPTTIINIREMAIASGLKYVYTGNIVNDQASSTYCPQCKDVKIKRSWRNTNFNNLNQDGICKNCGYQIDGIFTTN